MQRLALRARQIRALYQRELTATHRNPHATTEQKARQIESLWRQTIEQLADLRQRAGSLADADEQTFAAPPRPVEISGND